MGSAYYMSPEQVEAKKSLDHRTDIYSLGAVLYELASDRKLFEGNSCFDLMEAHVKKAPTPLLELDPSLPEALNDAIVRALSKKPGDRFASAREFREELELIRNELALPPPLDQADPFAETDDLPVLSRRREKDDPLLGWIDRMLRSTAVQITAGVVGLFLIVYMAALAYRPLAPREEITQEEPTRPEIAAESEPGSSPPADDSEIDLALMGPPQPEVAEVQSNRPRPRRRAIVRSRRRPPQDVQEGAKHRRELPLSGVRLDTGRRTEPEPVGGVRATPPTAPPSNHEGRSTRRLAVQPESASPSLDPFRADGLHAPAHRLSAGDAVQALALSRDGRFAAVAKGRARRPR